MQFILHNNLIIGIYVDQTRSSFDRNLRKWIRIYFFALFTQTFTLVIEASEQMKQYYDLLSRLLMIRMILITHNS